MDSYSITDQTYIPLTVEGVSQKKDGTILGEVVNSNEYDFDSVQMIVIFKDKEGKLLGGDFSFVDNLTAKGKVAFEIDPTKIEADSFDVYAIPQN